MTEWKYNNRYYDNNPEDVAATVLDNAEVDVPNRNIKWRSMFDADEVISEASDFLENHTLNASDEVPLNDMTSYLIEGAVNLDDINASGIRLGFQTPIFARTPSNGVLYKTATSGGLLRGSGEPFISTFMTYAAPGGEIFDLSADNTTDFLVHLCNSSDLGGMLPDAGGGGTVSGFRVQNFKAMAFDHLTSGITLAGDTRKTLIDGCPFRFIKDGTSAINLASDYDAGDFKLSGSYFKNFDANLYILNAAAGYNIDRVALVADNQGDEVVEANINGVGPSTIGWEFRGNDEVADSKVSGDLTSFDNTQTTTFSASGTYKQPAGTTSLENAERISSPANYTIQYDGQRRLPSRQIFGSVTATGAGPDEYRFALFKDSGSGYSIVSRTRRRINIGNVSASQANFSLAGNAELNTGDKLQLRVQNADATNGITVNDVDLIV